MSITLGLLSLVYTLPLCIVAYSSNSPTGQTSTLIGLSIFSIMSTSSLDLLLYLTIPAYFLQLLLTIVLYFKCKELQGKIDHSKMFPNNYALFLRLPAIHLSEEEVCQQIEAWFKR
jgi:hypothetical protein